MKLEAFTNEDLPALSRMRPEGWGDIEWPHRLYLRHAFCHPGKVLIEGEMAGIGTSLVFGKSAWLAHIIVHPDFQKRGIGGFIVSELMNRIKTGTECESVSLIATDQGFPLYLKSGFATLDEYVFYSLPPDLPLVSPDPPHRSIRPFENLDRERLMHLDRLASGEDRSAILEEFLSGALVYEEEGGIAGFLLPDLGEGLIVADHETAGLALMNLRLGSFRDAVVPVKNEAAGRFLEERGFTEKRRAKRMIHGRNVPWDPTKIFSRIGGYLG